MEILLWAIAINVAVLALIYAVGGLIVWYERWREYK